MNLITSIKIFFGSFLLKSKMKKLQRNKAVHNLTSAKTVGLVYLYKNEDEFKIVENLIAKLRNQKKDVKALVFLPYVKLLEYIPQKLSIDFITPTDLNFFMHPGGQRSNEFIDREFDVFIDLNIEKYFPLEYVTALSKANFKVGVFETKKIQVYDMMLKFPKEEELIKIIEQSLHYLDMVNPA